MGATRSRPAAIPRGLRRASVLVVLLLGACTSATLDLPPSSPGHPAAPAAPVERPSGVLEEDPPPPGGQAPEGENEPPADPHGHHDHGTGG